MRGDGPEALDRSGAADGGGADAAGADAAGADAAGADAAGADGGGAGDNAADHRAADDGGGPAGLRRRLDSLPDGHPSSRYEADGTPRTPAPRLRDLDTWTDDDEPALEDVAAGPDETIRPDEARGLTDAEWAEHVADVRTRLEKAHADGLATNRQYTIDPDGEQWTPARDHVQGDLVAEFHGNARDVPNERRAIIAGGLGGAGKSTILDKHAGIDLSRYLTINPDGIKEKLASRGLVPEIDGLSPMEACDLVHEESSDIAKQLARKALSDGKNVIWDITMSSRESVRERIEDLRAAGYTVDGIFVDIPVETSIQRADFRHREGQNDYRAGVGLGGRYVPPEVIRVQADPDWGSKNRRVFEELKPRFDHWARYDNSVNGRSPVLIETSHLADKNREEKT